MENLKIIGNIETPEFNIGQMLEGDVTNLPPSITRAILEYRLKRQANLFDGLLAINSTLGESGKVPKPKIISSLRKLLFDLDSSPSQLALETTNLTENLGISDEQANKIILAAQTISEELRRKNLIYRNQPFNFALTTPYPFSRNLAERIALLSTQALQAVDELSREEAEVDYLLNRGSSLWDKKLWRNRRDNYPLFAPLNRIDVINGKIIEFGPTYTDGFATAQILAEAWGIGSASIRTLGETFINLYQQQCLYNQQRPKMPPSLGLVYINQTAEMKDEMEAVGQKLAELDQFSQISLGWPSKIQLQNPDIIYYYLKPSMLDAYRGQPLPEGKTLIKITRNACVVPPLREQLGKKVVMAIFNMYPRFFTQRLGDSNYQELLSLVNSTQIVTPDLKLSDDEWILKPSSEGSCNGVISNSDPDFDKVLQQARAAFSNSKPDLWIVQPRLKEIAKMLVVKPSKKPLTIVRNLSVKQTLMVANQKAAGAFATASSKWIIDDGGFGYPCKFIGGPSER